MAKNLKGKKNFNFIIMAFILIFYLGLTSCAMLGMGEKAEESVPAKEETPPPPKAEPLPPKPEISPTPPPPVAPPPPPPVKEAQPPVAPPPPSPEPKKEEVKPAPAPAPIAVYVITLKNANVRSEPDLKSKIITTLKKGTKVEKIGQTGDWVHVKLSSEKTGWIFHELVKEVE